MIQITYKCDTNVILDKILQYEWAQVRNSYKMGHSLPLFGLYSIFPNNCGILHEINEKIVGISSVRCKQGFELTTLRLHYAESPPLTIAKLVSTKPIEHLKLYLTM